MLILRRPFHYTAIAAMVLFAIPAFILNLWIIRKGNTAALLRPANLWWIAVHAVWVLATLRSLLKAKWLGFWMFQGLSGFMLLGNVVLLVSTKNYALAFFALFLLILSGMYSLHLYKNLNEPYYDSGQHWFEGAPRLLPHIDGMIQLKKQQVPIRLSRLGEEGCFVHVSQAVMVPRHAELVLKMGELHLESAVESVSKSKDGRSWGLRFVSTVADEHKDIRDFIDRVRSAGYVS